MLRNLSELRRYVIEARDGEIGRCHDFLFDDRHWTIRYMVADTTQVAAGSQSAYLAYFIGIARLAGQAFSGEIDSRTG